MTPMTPMTVTPPQPSTIPPCIPGEPGCGHDDPGGTCKVMLKYVCTPDITDSKTISKLKLDSCDFYDKNIIS